MKEKQATVTVQRTSKPIKAFGALFSLALIFSVVLVIFGGDGAKGVGFFGIALSTLAIIFTRWVRWWQHD